MANITRAARNNQQKEIIKLFASMQGKYSMWELWGDFIQMIAISISNSVDKEHWESREKLYMDISSKYSKREFENLTSIFAMLVNAYEINPDQDLLGEIFMGLGLGNDRNGQFFTPYDVCRCMSEVTWSNIPAQIEKKGWISVNDPAVGAGALLIAFANTCKNHKINYQQHVLFTAQEIDFVTACMCYIQLSLLGCPGYVYVGNTITDPCTILDKRGLFPKPSNNLWFTPMYFHELWHYRRIWAQMDMLFSSDAVAPKEPKQEQLQEEKESGIIMVENDEIELLATESGQLRLF